MNDLGSSWKYRAGFMGMAANGNHIIPGLTEKIISDPVTNSF
jgi:hypothetical protein